MRKLVTLTMAVLMVGLFAAVVFAAVEAGDDPNARVGTTDTTETTGTTETTTTRTDDSPAGRIDISGPCDEAEHANDPRCTGAQTGVAPRIDDDDRGRGRGGDDFGQHGGDDDSGDHGGNSGHGGGDDFDDDDDHSGSGHGGDEDSGDDHGGNSGHGGGDED